MKVEAHELGYFLEYKTKAINRFDIPSQNIYEVASPCIFHLFLMLSFARFLDFLWHFVYLCSLATHISIVINNVPPLCGVYSLMILGSGHHSYKTVFSYFCPKFVIPPVFTQPLYLIKDTIQELMAAIRLQDYFDFRSCNFSCMYL